MRTPNEAAAASHRDSRRAVNGALGGPAPRLALLSALAITLAGAAALPGPARAGNIYWCNDGTAVAYTSSCGGHGGYTPIARPKPGEGRGDKAAPISDQGTIGGLIAYLAFTPSDEPCIFDRWGKVMTDKKGCRLGKNKEPACLKSGGALAETGGKRFCIPRQPTARK